MSATIVAFLKNDTCFDPDAVHAMGQAYDAASKALHDRGQPYIVQEVLARRIIEIARTGERDPGTICDRALKAFGIDRS